MGESVCLYVRRSTQLKRLSCHNKVHSGGENNVTSCSDSESKVDSHNRSGVLMRDADASRTATPTLASSRKGRGGAIIITPPAVAGQDTNTEGKVEHSMIN